MSVQFRAQGEFESDFADMVVDDDTVGSSEVRMYPLQQGPYRRSLFACPRYTKRDCSLLLMKLALTLVLVLAGFLVGYYSTTTPTCNLLSTLTDYDKAIVDASNELVDAQRIGDSVQQVSKKAHLAGTEENKEVFDWIVSEVRNMKKFTSKTYTYDVLLQQPLKTNDIQNRLTANTVELLDTAGKVVARCDDCDPIPNGFVPFTAFSGPGEIVGEPVFVNFGREEDFQRLKDESIDCSQRVLIAKLGMEPRAMIAWRAFNDYCVSNNPNRTTSIALLVYPDPVMFPAAMDNETSAGVNRYLDAFGDLRTPFLPSVENVYREVLGEVLREQADDVLIQPISNRFAARILSDMAGKQFTEWKGDLKNVPYNTGPGYDAASKGYKIRVRVSNKWDFSITGVPQDSMVHNLVVSAPGFIERDRYVIVGAHYDSLTAGAIDNGGSVAVLLELMRVLNEQYNVTWKPRRTVLFAFWDGEEMGQIGSTEFIEELGLELEDRTVAYVNLDCVVSGSSFFTANEHPLFYSLVVNATGSVNWPKAAGISIAQRWVLDTAANLVSKIPQAGALFARYNTEQQQLLASMIDLQVTDSDIVSWWTERGVPFIAPRFVGKPVSVSQRATSPLWPPFGTVLQGMRTSGTVPHSSSDTFESLRQLDPNWALHAAMARIVLILTHRMADSMLLPMNPVSFASFILLRFNAFAEQYSSTFKRLESTYPQLQLSAQRDAVALAFNKLLAAAGDYASRAESLDRRSIRSLTARRMNDRIMLLDHAFDTTYNEEFRGSTSTLFAPNRAYEQRTIVFPGVREALDQLKSLGVDPNNEMKTVRQLSRELSALLVGAQQATRLLVEQDSFLTD